MHSRVFEVSLTPIENPAEFDVIPDWWINQYCDYIVPSGDVEEDIKWLCKGIDAEYKRNDGVIIITAERVDQILKDYYTEFLEAIVRLNSIDETKWMTEPFTVDSAVWGVKNAVNDTCGFWFYTKDGMYTLQELMRDLKEMKDKSLINEDNKREYFALYVGTTWDYHI